MCFPLDEEEGGKPPAKWLVPGALDPFQPAAVAADWQKPGGVRQQWNGELGEALPSWAQGEGVQYTVLSTQLSVVRF